MDYVHINPLKRGLVHRVIDWPYSTFHLLAGHGGYPAVWAGGDEDQTNYRE
jgi:putative transposase